MCTVLDGGEGVEGVCVFREYLPAKTGRGCLCWVCSSITVKTTVIDNLPWSTVLLVHIILLVSVLTNPLPNPPSSYMHTHTHTLIPLFCEEGSFFSTCAAVPVCLLPEASGTPGPVHTPPSFISALWFAFLPVWLLCLQSFFQVYSYE